MQLTTATPTNPPPPPPKSSSNKLMFYAQSTGAIISGQPPPKKKSYLNQHDTRMVKTNQIQNLFIFKNNERKVEHGIKPKQLMRGFCLGFCF